MTQYNLKYKVQKASNGGRTREYIFTEQTVEANTEEDAKTIITSSYVDTQDITHDIKFL